jgi:hypothetical protein
MWLFWLCLGFSLGGYFLPGHRTFAYACYVIAVGILLWKAYKLYQSIMDGSLQEEFEEFLEEEGLDLFDNGEDEFLSRIHRYEVDNPDDDGARAYQLTPEEFEELYEEQKEKVAYDKSILDELEKIHNELHKAAGGSEPKRLE